MLTERQGNYCAVSSLVIKKYIYLLNLGLTAVPTTIGN